ncbi:MAG: DUF2207 domain-containing protein [Chitinophagaceae bacterium]|nr:DUF2207 domain-containing protein [Chitinophagaceae bacterium]
MKSFLKGLILLLLCSLNIHAKEKDKNDRILSFDQQIKITPEGKLQVHELITIYNGENDNLNNSIKRGLVRDFPTTYINSFGLISKVPFELKSVERDGEKEDYHLEQVSNGIRMYLGRSDYFLPEGNYTYHIEYETSKQLIFHENKDELYWNVTGTGWEFTIDYASCLISFPDEAKLIENKCYTGAQGSSNQDCNSMMINQHAIQFETSKKLEAFEGLTIAAAVQKGVFKPSDNLDNFTTLLKDNLIIPILGLSVFGLFIFLYTVWRKYGKDPKKGTIIPEFAPPKKMSPTDIGYAKTQTYSTRLLSAAIVDMVLKKCLHVETKKEGLIFKSTSYTFSKINPDDKVQSTFYALYGFDADQLHGEKAAKGDYNERIASASAKLENKLEERLEYAKNEKGSFSSIFTRNNQYVGIAIVFLFLLGIGSTIWLGYHHSNIKLIILAALIFIVGILISFIFSRIMSAYSIEGRKIMDQIEGFELYLSTTEKHRFDQLNPPEENIQLFEKYYPYAIALGVENRWAEKFKSAIETALQQGYVSPINQFGYHSNFASQSFASNFASNMSNTISSASTPPSSSGGGSSGGGFSGGGGGGGGGGGW